MSVRLRTRAGPWELAVALTGLLHGKPATRPGSSRAPSLPRRSMPPRAGRRGCHRAKRGKGKRSDLDSPAAGATITALRGRGTQPPARERHPRTPRPFWSFGRSPPRSPPTMTPTSPSTMSVNRVATARKNAARFEPRRSALAEAAGAALARASPAPARARSRAAALARRGRSRGSGHAGPNTRGMPLRSPARWSARRRVRDRPAEPGDGLASIRGCGRWRPARRDCTRRSAWPRSGELSGRTITNAATGMTSSANAMTTASGRERERRMTVDDAWPARRLPAAGANAVEAL